MQFSLAPSDLDFCARTIAVMDDSEADHVRAALAWLIRNRLNHVAAAAAEPPSVAKTCKLILREAVGRAKPDIARDAMPNADWCRFYAVTCQVWAGDVPDHTRGATFCHRHDRAPAWAKNRAPTALIGSYLFYR